MDFLLRLGLGPTANVIALDAWRYGLASLERKGPHCRELHISSHCVFIKVNMVPVLWLRFWFAVGEVPYYGHYIMERHVTPISICLPPPPFHPRVSPISYYMGTAHFEGALDLYKFHKIFGVPIAQVHVHVHVVVEYKYGWIPYNFSLPFSSSSGTRNSERVSQKSDHRPLLRSILTGIGYSDFSRFRAARKGLRLDGGVVAYSMYLVKFVVSGRGFFMKSY